MSLSASRCCHISLTQLSIQHSCRSPIKMDNLPLHHRSVALPYDVRSTIRCTSIVGLFMNWGLIGVLTVQVYIYHLFFPRDSVYLKSLV
ncbi:hypothetical protein C8Q74DRAFT_1256140 [Fomes fomentarius]|nr:hypothetical protein C8Q74DRAFT_1256140 [Fomes fomentarius]